MISALDNHLLRAYLDGEMDEAAAEMFEILMIERPELAERVDADTALRMGLRPADALSPVRAAAQPAAAAPARPRRSPLQHWVPLLAAASLLLAVGLTLGRLWPSSSGILPTTLLSVDRMRSSMSEVPKLRLPAQGQVVLSVPVVGGSDCTPRIRVLQQGATLEAEATPDDYGFVNLGMSVSRLSTGKAEVAVYCGERETARYPVEFLR